MVSAIETPESNCSFYAALHIKVEIWSMLSSAPPVPSTASTGFVLCNSSRTISASWRILKCTDPYTGTGSLF